MNKNLSFVLRTGLLVGTFDITAALILYFLRTGNKDVLNVLKFVASGFFGNAATTGGAAMIIAGFFFHYCIAISFTLFFFRIYPSAIALLRHKLLLGFVYGMFVWSVMNLVVVPLSRIGSRPFNLVNASLNLLILVLCIGIPLTFIANQFYKRQPTKGAVAAV